MKNSKPTLDQYGAYQGLYDFLNKELFNGGLNDCILTMIPSRRNNGGHFWAEKWHKDGKPLHEISMNPQGYKVDDSKVFVSILLHEMCHLWVEDNIEKSPRSGYHCKKWGSIMKKVG